MRVLINNYYNNLSLLFLLAISLVGMSCQQSKKTNEAGQISTEKLGKIMMELAEIDQYFTYIPGAIATDSLSGKRAAQYDRVFRENGVTKEVFLEAYKKLSANPKQAKALFDTLSKQANKKIGDGVINQPR